ncbi:MAG: glycosyltransferase family 39 protein [Candidatus Xenobia bacterium]
MRNVPWLLVAAIGLAAFLRIAGLGAAGLTNDEAYDVWVASLPLSAYHVVLANDAHPPLFYWLLHVWEMRVGDGVAATRLLSALFGCLTCYLVWWWGRQLSPQIAVVSALLYACSPLAVDLDRYVKSYSLMMCLVTFSTALLLTACRTPRRGLWVGYTATSVVLLYTHYFAPLILLGHLISVPASSRRRVFLACALAGLAFLPWLPMLEVQRRQCAGLYIFAPFSWKFYGTFLASLLGLGAFKAPTLVAILVGALVPLVLLWGLFQRELPLMMAARLCTLYLAVLTANTLMSPIHTMQTRYTSIVLVPFLLLLASGITRMRLLPASGRQALALVTGVLVAFNLLGCGLEVFDPGSVQQQWDVTATRIEQEHGRGDAILLVPSFNLFPFVYHFGGLGHLRWQNQQLSIVPYPDVTLYPIQAPFNPALIDAACQTRGRVWVVATEGDALIHTVTEAITRHHFQMLGGFEAPGRFSNIVVGVFRQAP